MTAGRPLAIVVLGAFAALVILPGLAKAAAPLLKSQAEPDTQDILFLGPTRPVWIRLHVTNDGRPFRELWNERFDELFEAEDRDADGRVDFDGAGNVVREMNGDLADGAASSLKEAMPEGTIDRAALRSHVERTLPPFALRPRAVIGQGAALALFPLLDSDQDGKLSAGELAAAETRLRARDFDDNGAITPGELILDPKALAAASSPNAAEPALDASETPVLAVDAATTADELADRLLKHYDRDRDGRLTTESSNVEIKLSEPLLNRCDADGDRVLTGEELARLTAWNPDLELQFPFGQADARAARSRGGLQAPEGFRVRRKLLGGYELDLDEARIDFNRNNRDPRQADLVDLRTYDRDNNQYLDAREAAASGIGKTAFAAMDVDGDAKVFKGELTSYVTRQNEAASVRVHLQIRDLGQDLFGALDADFDGLLSARDLRQARTLLDALDRNGDGMLALAEIPARLEFELVRGIDERAGDEAQLVRRVVRPTNQAETTGPLWFRKMDRNNDGDLGRREFVGPRAAFDRLDKDRDGLIDRSEAEAVGK
jgi:Ca2+-binding EF-hand superfamily protein